MRCQSATLYRCNGNLIIVALHQYPASPARAFVFGEGSQTKPQILVTGRGQSFRGQRAADRFVAASNGAGGGSQTMRLHRSLNYHRQICNIPKLSLSSKGQQPWVRIETHGEPFGTNVADEPSVAGTRDCIKPSQSSTGQACILIILYCALRNEEEAVGMDG